MNEPFVIVSSITYAYKGQSILDRYGCRSYIEREPAGLSDCGCHYILRIKNFPVEKAADILRYAHVRVIGTGR